MLLSDKRLLVYMVVVILWEAWEVQGLELPKDLVWRTDHLVLLILVLPVLARVLFLRLLPTVELALAVGCQECQEVYQQASHLEQPTC